MLSDIHTARREYLMSHRRQSLAIHPITSFRAFTLAVLLVFLVLGAVIPVQAQKVHVHGYYKKNGTYVAPHDRSYPGTSAHKASSHRPSSDGSHASSLAARDSKGKIKRSAAAKSTFKRENPCPSTGKRSGSCPGYTVDHVNPLECGGVDAPGNMQWQTVADAKAKDKIEGNCRK
jgi:hypothetical protein